MREREVIAEFFDFAAGEGVRVGVGDDAAVLSPPRGRKLAMSTDTLIAGVHFLPSDNPFFVARKAAAATLSDLAATGARPLWMTLSLTLGRAVGRKRRLTLREGKARDEALARRKKWFAEIARGFKNSAAEYGYSIVGGDLARGDETKLTTTALGELAGAPLLRTGARAGDDIWLSGCVGDAALALRLRKKNPGVVPPLAHKRVNERLHNPQPRLELGLALAGLASAAIDLSDGLASGACDLARASGVCLLLDSAKLPASPAMRRLRADMRRRLMLEGGDDYELLFCADPRHRKTLDKKFGGVRISRIGEVCAGGGAFALAGGARESLAGRGYEHDFGD